MSFSHKYEEGIKKISFLARHHGILKQNYIAIFILLSLVSICVFVDPQCFVCQGDFIHKVVNWSTFESGARNYENVYKVSRCSHLEVLRL